MDMLILDRDLLTELTADGNGGPQPTFFDLIHGVWKGDGVAVGLYSKPQDSIPEASQRMIEALSARLRPTTQTVLILDRASGSGQAGMRLAKHLGKKVTRLRIKNSRQSPEWRRDSRLADQVAVFDGSCEDIPLPDSSVDAVWSQDAILSEGNAAKVFEEIGRVLTPGGELIFTDPLRLEDPRSEEEHELLSRLGLPGLVSLDRYVELAGDAGLEKIKTVELTAQLIMHYHHLWSELKARSIHLTSRFPEDHIRNLLKTLQAWLEATRLGQITWGILHFRKPEESGN